jgi:hypothetical protein
MRVRMAKEYQVELMHPCHAAERGLVDDVIDRRRDPPCPYCVADGAAQQARRPAVL